MWDQVDLEHQVLHLDSNVKTTGSAQPLPLSRLACDVLKEWKHKRVLGSPYVFPSSRKSGEPLGTVKKAWRSALKKAGVPYFPIYNLRHVFCTRLSWVAPDAVVQRAIGTAVRRRSVTTNSAWWTKFVKVLKRPTNRPTVTRSYYVSTTFQKTRRNRLRRRL